MDARRKWTNEQIAAALLMTADVGRKETASAFNTTPAALASLFHYYGLSVLDARKSIGEKKQVAEISLGYGRFEPIEWAIPLSEWCSSARQLLAQPDGCRWIEGDPPEAFSYCCKPIFKGKFCRKHFLISRKKTVDKIPNSPYNNRPQVRSSLS